MLSYWLERLRCRSSAGEATSRGIQRWRESLRLLLCSRQRDERGIAQSCCVHTQQDTRGMSVPPPGSRAATLSSRSSQTVWGHSSVTTEHRLSTSTNKAMPVIRHVVTNLHTIHLHANPLIMERTSLVPLQIALWILIGRILIRRILPLGRVLHSLRRRHVPLRRAVPWLLIPVRKMARFLAMGREREGEGRTHAPACPGCAYPAPAICGSKPLLRSTSHSTHTERGRHRMSDRRRWSQGNSVRSMEVGVDGSRDRR
jgi:hypothetical protein